MNWEQTVWNAVVAFGHFVYDTLHAIGFGGGFFLFKFIHHWPAPATGSRWYAAVVDALWDLVGSKRMGERRAPDGSLVNVTPVTVETPALAPTALSSGNASRND